MRASRGGRDADLRLRLALLRGDDRPEPGLDRGVLERIRQAARDYRRRLGLRAGEQAGSSGDTGLVLSFAYPDRIARRRPGGEPRYTLSGGQGAAFAAIDPLAAEQWLCVADLDGDRREARIYLAAPLTLAEIETHFADEIETVTVCAWEARDETVLARRQRRLDRLVLEDRPNPAADPEAIAAAMVETHGEA